MRSEHGIELDAQRSKHVSELTELRFDLVITLCDRVREVCPEIPGRPEAVHWSIADPSVGHGDDQASYPAFIATARELDTRVGFLLATLAAPTTPS
jgi:protein-tyrosine-phosphatase